ncbi:IS91 family transposase [Microbulbifer halophilus]|uniref:Transposase n=1 Tax=Microbulbifer halophilus TaxID=453963 RepID=A0ABW5EEZ9_9GAMM|nr:transposase [Microbulbifer halophilus]MCW8128397.1 transposase [Microbulbifer halophilus]
MRLASLIERHEGALLQKYGARLLPEQRRAMDAIRHCRTTAAGEVLWQCKGCSHALLSPRSCGHRSCLQCQNHEATQWLDRQRRKLLPVEYFMVTFTLPAELRPLAWRHQKVLYDLLMTVATGVLKDFGLNDKHLGGNLGMTGVLHTHTRRLDYHPHCHIVVPGGAVDRRRRQWRKARGSYLFNGRALAKVFRARVLEALRENGFEIPVTPAQWVVQCQSAGRGQPALEYLSRYLYRGVISEKQILCERNGEVTFRYIESKSGKPKTRTVPGANFLWLVLQHVLPKGFRRVRDYGFLHGNAKRLLQLVQMTLQVVIKTIKSKGRPVLRCPRCHSPMAFVRAFRPGWLSG